MNTTLLHRRRIERYAQLLDGATGERPSSHARSSVDAELNELVTLGNRVSGAKPTDSMDLDKRAEIRAYLMATAEREGIGVTAIAATASPAVGRARVGVTRKSISTKTSGPSRTRTRGAILVGLAVGTLALSGISAASGDAVPGDTLYGLKLSQESAQLALAGSSVAKGRLYLDFAGVRLDEAQIVRTNAKRLDGALDAMDKDTALGAKLLLTAAMTNHDANALASVKQFLANQGLKLDDLRKLVVGVDHARVLKSVLTPIELRVRQIESAIACDSKTVTDTDSLGPIPAGCQEATTVTPTPGHSTGGGSTGGKSGTSNHKGQAPPNGAPTAAPDGKTAALAGRSGSTTSGDASVTPEPAATTADDGLLGGIGHLLGGILGH